MDIQILFQTEVVGLQLDRYNTSDKEILLYSYISEAIDFDNSNYRFLSDGNGMGYFGIEFKFKDTKVRYSFERGYGEILIDDVKINEIHASFDENSIKKNIDTILNILESI